MKELTDAELQKLKRFPKWLRTHVANMTLEVNKLKKQLDGANKANHICDTMEWFTIGSFQNHPTKLFTLSEHGARHITTVDKNNILLIGRDRQPEETKNVPGKPA